MLESVERYLMKRILWASYMIKITEKDISELAVIGSGSCATVYQLDDTKILKMYDRQKRNSFEFVKKEFDISSIIYGFNVPTAKPYDLYECDGVYGASYEFLHGDTMLDAIANGADVSENIKCLAEIGKQIHSKKVDKTIFPKASKLLEDLLAHMKNWLDENQINHIAELIASIPEYDIFIHGDFHPGNIIIHNGKPMLIDVGGAGHGHPVFDLLSMYRMMKMARKYKKYDAKIFPEIYNCYIEHYFDKGKLEKRKDSFYELLDFIYIITVVSSACATFVDKQSCPPEIINYIDGMIEVLTKMTSDRLCQLFENTNDLFFD